MKPNTPVAAIATKIVSIPGLPLLSSSNNTSSDDVGSAAFFATDFGAEAC